MPDAKDHRGAVRATPGTPFEVRLGFGPSTGYTWQLLPSEHVELLDVQYETDPRAQVGDPAFQVFRLVTHTAGRFRLCFVLKQRWGEEVAETSTVDVIAE